MLVTMLVMGVVATAVLAVGMRAFTDTATIMNRRDVFDDARVALDRFSKQLRQGEVVSSSTASSITFTGYLDEVETTFIWRTTGTAAPYSLEESTDGGAHYYTILTVLSSTDLFTYTTHGSVTDEVTITLPLKTLTSSVTLTSDVHLRNAQT
jgi:type II secretory pathway pseudopilin PulG